MYKELLIINEKNYPVFIFVEKRNNVSASIRKKGICIRIPSFLSREEQFKQIRRLKDWASKKLQEQPFSEIKEKGWKNYKDEDTLTLGKEEYTLKIIYADKEGSSSKIERNTIFLRITNRIPEEEQRKHISTLISRTLAQEKHSYITNKIHELNKKHFNFEIRNIFLKYNTSNWGSCSHQGNINISTRLLLAPEDVLDYVCVHELSHLKEKNHSPSFWKLVETAMPDYKEKKKWLHTHRDTCWF